jgi:hypothetical protein
MFRCFVLFGDDFAYVGIFAPIAFARRAEEEQEAVFVLSGAVTFAHHVPPISGGTAIPS